ncbi:MAG: DNA repair protein RecO [Candidatus Omnitrophica bacterium]|nr:DNA repair protein RecO [Candidatus Omnitrophota bacterium]
MAIEKATGIVLRRRDFRDTSFVVSVFSREFGKFHGLLKGARSEKSRFGSIVEPVTLNDFVFYHGQRTDLHLVSQCDLVKPYLELRKDLIRLGYANYVVALLEQMMELMDPHPEAFDLAERTLDWLQWAPNPVSCRLSFEIRLLTQLGSFPDLSRCSGCSKSLAEPGEYFGYKLGGFLCESCRNRDPTVDRVSKAASATLRQLAEADFSFLPRLSMSPEMASDLENLMERHLVYHLGSLPKPARFLQAMKQRKKIHGNTAKAAC